MADEEISVGAKFLEWWPKTPEKQANWRQHWALALKIEPKPGKWTVSFVARRIAKEEIGVKTITEEVESRADTIRKCLGKMRTEGGPPEK